MTEAKFWLTDEELQKEVEANLRSCRRVQELDRNGAGWGGTWEGVYTILVDHKSGVLKAFDLDPRRSVLFDEFPQLLWAACDPQQPIVYSPVFREFGMPVFDGGLSYAMFRFDPWTGKALPASVRDAFFDEARKLLGADVGLLDEALEALPEEFRSETWWINRGL